MKVALDYRIRVGDTLVDSKNASQHLDTLRGQVAKEGTLEGPMLLILDGAEHGAELVDPLLRLGAQWIRKLPWILSVTPKRWLIATASTVSDLFQPAKALR